MILILMNGEVVNECLSTPTVGCNDDWPARSWKNYLGY